MGLLWLLLLLATDSIAGVLAAFPAGNGYWHLGTLTAGNLDDAPDLEVVVPYRDLTGNWFLAAYKWNGALLPGFPYAAGGEEMNVSPTLHDLDGDGRDEILFSRANRIIALRGDGSVKWSSLISRTNYLPNSGFQVVTNGFYWSGNNAWLGQLPAGAVFSAQVSPPIVADLTGQGAKEIVTAWKIDPDGAAGLQDFNPFINDVWGSGEWGTMGETWSGGVIFFNAQTGQKNFIYHLHQLVESGLAVGRASSHRLSAYVLNDSDSVVCFDKTKPFGLWGAGMLHKQFGKNQRLMSGSYQAPVDIYAADIDGDGLDECLVAGTQPGTLWEPNETILDDDGAILWRRWLPHLQLTNNCGWLNGASLIPVNPDHDNHVDVLGWNHGYEVTFRYWNGIELVGRPGWPRNFSPQLPTPPVVGDVDGDGQEEILIGTYHPSQSVAGNLFVYALDGTLKQSVAVPGGLKHIPMLADVNNDGGLDVVYRSMTGVVTVQNFGATTPTQPSWATHRGNKNHDGNLGVPLFPPGTPLVTSKVPGYLRTSFDWTAPQIPDGYKVFRADSAAGPFVEIAALPASQTHYADHAGLKPGWLYFYEVAACYGTNVVRSSPFAILSGPNGNLLANSGLEEDGHSHWDKWFSDEIAMTNIFASPNPFQGRRAMQVRFQNSGGGNSISQFNQYGIPDATLPVNAGAFYSFGGWLKSEGLTQPSEHWFEWLSSRTAANTNARPARMYPDYFTPHFKLGSGSTNWLYANRVFQIPAGFPNAEFTHGYTVSAKTGGSIFLDALFFRELPAPGSNVWRTLVPFGATWKYFANTAPANWYAPSFNDSAWPQGTAKFGAGGGPRNVVTPLPQFRPAYHFRTPFTLADTNLQEFLLSATCTDDTGGVTYPLRLFLNGTEVLSSGMEVVTGQGNDVRYFDLLPFVSLLQRGSNTVAVQVSNAWSSWDDVAFDVCLKAVPATSVTPRVYVVACDAAGTQLAAETPWGSVFQLQSSDTLANDWQPVQTFTNSTGGVQYLQDSGQNGRARPGAVPQRFYRIVPQ